MFRLMIFDSQNDVNQFGLYLYFSISITKQLHIMFELQISSCKSCFNSPPEGETSFFFAQVAISQSSILKILSHIVMAGCYFYEPPNPVGTAHSLKLVELSENSILLQAS